MDVRSSFASGRKCDVCGLSLGGMVRPEAEWPLSGTSRVEAAAARIPADRPLTTHSALGRRMENLPKADAGWPAVPPKRRHSVEAPRPLADKHRRGPEMIRSHGTCARSVLQARPLPAHAPGGGLPRLTRRRPSGESVAPSPQRPGRTCIP